MWKDLTTGHFLLELKAPEAKGDVISSMRESSPKFAKLSAALGPSRRSAVIWGSGYNLSSCFPLLLDGASSQAQAKCDWSHSCSVHSTLHRKAPQRQHHQMTGSRAENID